MNVYTKRKYHRVEFVQQARLEFLERNYDPCRIRNLSLTGMFVCGDFSQQKGDECVIRFSQTSTSTHFYFKARARIIRLTGDGIAVEFVSMPLDSYMLLQTTLLYEAIDPLAISLQLPDDCPFEITLEVSKDEDEGGEKIDKPRVFSSASCDKKAH